MKAVVKQWITGQRGGQVEAKAIHTERLDPPAQAIHHPPYVVRFTHIQGVTAASRVEVMASAIHGIAAGVVQTSPAQRGPPDVGLCGVIEDHIKDHLQAVPMKLIDHRAELVSHRLDGRTGISGFRHEKPERVVAPIIGKARRQ